MRLAAVWFMGLLALTASGPGRAETAKPASLPQSSVRLDIHVAGEALATALPRLGSEFGLRLAPGRELEAQRVTLYLADASSELLAWGLAELLSADAEARVSWERRSGERWFLEEGVSRRRLAARLRDEDLERFRQHMERELQWLHGKAAQDLERARALSPSAPHAVEARMTLALLLEHLGVAGRDKLLAGVPFYAQIGQLPVELRNRYRQNLHNRSPHLQHLPLEALDAYWFALVLARPPGDPLGTHLIESLVKPYGFLWARRGRLIRQGQHTPPFARPTFQLPPVEESDRQRASRSVSLTLAPAPGVEPGTIRRHNLDQMLATLARETGLNVVADGYLRSPCPVPANLQVSDYPLEKLLDVVTGIWHCDWRFLDAEKTTVLVRAKGWWLEDLADVPQPVIERLREGLGGAASPTLTDLLQLAELSKAQIHKLIESGRLLGAYGIVTPGFYNDAGVKPCLQFFNRLSAPLQQRAQSPEGLPLREAPPDLVEQWLRTTLIVEAGAVTPEMQREVVFSLRPGSGNPKAPEGFEVAIRSLRPPGTLWVQHIQPPAGLGRRTSAPASAK